MDPHVRLRSSLVSAPTCPSWNRRARARSAPARVARLLARTAGIFWGALEVLCKAKQSSSALRAILAARYARHFGLFLGPLRGQGAHMGSMAPCCKTLLFQVGIRLDVRVQAALRRPREELRVRCQISCSCPGTSRFVVR